MLHDTHSRATYNRVDLEEATICGCFYCLEVYDPKLIVSWTDAGETAICPYCSIDAVLAGVDNKAFLEKMHTFWFTTTVEEDDDCFYEFINSDDNN